MTPLTTERLTLRRLTLDDGKFILALLNEPSFIEMIGDRGVRTVEEAQGYIRKGALASYERFGFGMYLTALKADGTPIGICGLLKRDTLPDIDIGFAFRPAFWRQGYAYESCVAVIEQGRREFGVKRLVAITSQENIGSGKVLEKLGLRFEKTIRLTDDGEELRLFSRDY